MARGSIPPGILFCHLYVKACADWTQDFLGRSSALREPAAEVRGSSSSTQPAAQHAAAHTDTGQHELAWLAGVADDEWGAGAFAAGSGWRGGGMARHADQMARGVRCGERSRASERKSASERSQRSVIGRRATRRARRCEWQGRRGVQAACGVGLAGLDGEVCHPQGRKRNQHAFGTRFVFGGGSDKLCRLDKSSLRSNFASSTLIFSRLITK